MLRALRLAQAAFDAVRRALELSRAAEQVEVVRLQRLPLSGERRVVEASEALRNVHRLRTGHAVRAARAGGPDAALQVRPDVVDHFQIRVAHAVRNAAISGFEVLFHLPGRAHSGEHHAHLGMVPHPAKAHVGQVRSVVARTGRNIAKAALDRHSENASLERLHDGHSDSLRRGIAQALRPGLEVPVEKVVLDLAHIPVVGVDHLPEQLHAVVERESDIADLSRGAGPLQEGESVELLHAPPPGVGHRVQQVDVDVVRLQLLELLVERALHVGLGVDDPDGILVTSMTLSRSPPRSARPTASSPFPPW